MIAKLISFWVSIPIAILLGLAPGIWLTEWWEHNPNPPAISTGHFLFWHWDFRPLAVQLSTSQAAFATEKRSFDVVYGALEQQNAAVRLLGQRATAWQAASRQAEVRAQAANAWRLSLADQILATPRPTDDSAAAQCKAAEGVLRETGQ